LAIDGKHRVVLYEALDKEVYLARVIRGEGKLPLHEVQGVEVGDLEGAEVFEELRESYLRMLMVVV
jgi:hypothetical protein